MGKRIVWTELARADIRAVEQPLAMQILETLGRYVLTGEGATKQLKGVSPPLICLRAQNHPSSSATTASIFRSSAYSTGRTPTAEGRWNRFAKGSDDGAGQAGVVG